MTDLLELGHRINLARKKADMSLEDVAYEVGVAASTIQRYEKGNITRIKLPVVGAIATALNVSPDWLLQKTDDPIDYYRIANEEGIVVPRDSDMNEEQILSYLKYKISGAEQEDYERQREEISVALNISIQLCVLLSGFSLEDVAHRLMIPNEKAARILTTDYSQCMMKLDEIAEMLGIKSTDFIYKPTEYYASPISNGGILRYTAEQISKKQCVLTDDGIKNVYRIIHKLFSATDAIVTDVSKYLDYVTYTNKSEENDDE